ncbi:LysR family transcriptional regulator [Hahella sp. KA22]|uniref:LysR family transcriptional regulator n=1 Tax=Hahella sp. KA22 TaxID=1628392 RepID=UPI000FDD2914|nr:LysR family transcriptional regulator [Hahella sp. KA22]AZZ91248.1 LysR family transcriptional regulator [Hahella sp. KA22]QAY54616.1 LysR family transcriptional regulator [Hahella sp. KA22]
MELVALRTFLAVVEEGGILAAASRLNTVQSNVTTRIRRLEQELEVQLFFRKGRGLELAPAGRVLQKHAQEILQMAQQTAAAVRSAGEAAGELRIGTMETFAAVRLPAALKKVRSRHPGLELQVQTATSADLIERVLSHKLDCAFIGGPLDHPMLIAEPVLAEELVLVTAKGESDLQEPLILFREGCVYRARALAWQRECGHQIASVMELGTLEGILGCVAVGLGCTLMPRRVVEQSPYAKELAISELPEHIAHTPTLMIRYRDIPLRGGMQTLRDAVAGRS